jgi:hypothetical protein
MSTRHILERRSGLPAFAPSAPRRPRPPLVPPMLVIGGVMALMFVAGCDHSAPHPSPPPLGADAGARTAAASPATETQAGSPPPVAPPSAAPPAPTPPPPLPATVRITVRTSPARKAKVYWGRKLLGVTPLQFERPRASGPLDLVLRADGYFPVHVRAYTDWNDGLTVELTKLSDRMKLFGAKRELPAEPVAAGTTPPTASPAPNPSAPSTTAGATPTAPAGSTPSLIRGAAGPIVPAGPSPAAPRPATR